MTEFTEEDVILNAGLRGEWTLEQIRQFMCDHGIVDATGIGPNDSFQITGKAIDLLNMIVACLATPGHQIQIDARKYLKALVDDDDLWGQEL